MRNKAAGMTHHTDRTVLCMKWGPLYPGSYVNVLHSAVRKHLEGPFRFVCLTPDPEGLDPDIEVYPIPDLGFSPRHFGHGAWPKLSVFQRDLYGLQGRALFIDLDSVIVGSLEPFFAMEGDFISIAGGPNWQPGNPNPEPRLASGVFAFDLGSLDYILDAFLADPMGALEVVENEQQFIEKHIHGWKTWPADWVISFKRHLRQPPLVDRFLPPRRPPEGARIVAFHGDPRPIDVARAGRDRWASFPRYGRGPVGWVRDYWLENGYSDPL